MCEREWMQTTVNLVLGYFITLGVMLSGAVLFSIMCAKYILDRTPDDDAHQVRARLTLHSVFISNLSEAFYFTGVVVTLYMLFVDAMRTPHSRPFMLAMFGISYCGRGLLGQFMLRLSSFDNLCIVSAKPATETEVEKPYE
jgi:hypothetical protein